MRGHRGKSPPAGLGLTPAGKSENYAQFLVFSSFLRKILIFLKNIGQRPAIHVDFGIGITIKTL